jgi:CRP-like cAMP-binding protein
MTDGAPESNLLFSMLPAAERARLRLQLCRVELERGDALGEPDVPLRHLYFPTSAVVSLLAAADHGPSTELALTGREGAVGVGLVLGSMPNAACAIVHVAGEAYRMPAAAAIAEFEASEPFRRLLLSFAQALITQISQAVVCNRHHSVDQALCRWLLMVQDRVAADDLHVTQQLIADSLGVRREAIVEAAGKLQMLGGIRTTRGVVRILDRGILEQRSCGCYGVVTEAFGALPAFLRPTEAASTTAEPL